MYFRFAFKNTLYMLEATVYLGASLFFGLLVFYIYRHYDDSKTQKPRQVSVPLRVDRKDLLNQKRRAVTDRRNRLNNQNKTADKQQLSTNAADNKTKDSDKIDATEAADDSFGEDLGAALTLSQKLTEPKPDRSTGRSRFGALKDAAAELRDVYNKNNSI